MEKSKIEWCDSTWNPLSGCYHPCPYCYARSTANRFKGCDCAVGGETDENVVYLKERLTVTSKDGVVRNAAYPFGFTPTFHEYRLNDPLTKGFGKTIFVCVQHSRKRAEFVNQRMCDFVGVFSRYKRVKNIFEHFVLLQSGKSASPYSFTHSCLLYTSPSPRD